MHVKVDNIDFELRFRHIDPHAAISRAQAKGAVSLDEVVDYLTEESDESNKLLLEVANTADFHSQDKRLAVPHTTCEILADGESVSSGVARLHPFDHYVKETGRRIALERACQALAKVKHDLRFKIPSLLEAYHKRI